MRVLSPMFPSLRDRLAEGRPVLAKQEVEALAHRILEMSSADTVTVSVAHTAQIITRMANSQVLSGDDGDRLEISVRTRFGDRAGMTVRTNQVDETTLRAMVQECEALAREGLGPDDVLKT